MLFTDLVKGRSHKWEIFTELVRGAFHKVLNGLSFLKSDRLSVGALQQSGVFESYQTSAQEQWTDALLFLAMVEEKNISQVNSHKKLMTAYYSLVFFHL